MNLNNTRTLVPGGTSFIGSHLVEALVDRGSQVRVADNLGSGRGDYLDEVTAQVELPTGDLLDREVSQSSVRDIDIVLQCAFSS